MALKRSFQANENSFGIAIPDAYCRIISGAFDDQEITFWVNVYADQAAREADASCLIALPYTIPHPDYAIGISKGDLYTWLKTQPPFLDAQDILE